MCIVHLVHIRNRAMLIVGCVNRVIMCIVHLVHMIRNGAMLIVEFMKREIYGHVA